MISPTWHYCHLKPGNSLLEGHPMHYGIFSNNPDLHLPDASSTPWVVTAKSVSRNHKTVLSREPLREAHQFTAQLCDTRVTKKTNLLIIANLAELGIWLYTFLVGSTPERCFITMKSTWNYTISSKNVHFSVLSCLPCWTDGPLAIHMDKDPDLWGLTLSFILSGNVSQRSRPQLPLWN